MPVSGGQNHRYWQCNWLKKKMVFARTSRGIDQ